MADGLFLSRQTQKCFTGSNGTSRLAWRPSAQLWPGVNLAAAAVISRASLVFAPALRRHCPAAHRQSGCPSRCVQAQANPAPGLPPLLLNLLATQCGCATL